LICTCRGYCIGGDVAARLPAFTEYLSERKDYGAIGKQCNI